MKKNVVKSIMIAVVAIFAGYNVYQSNMNSNELSDVMLANVEALAQGESTTSSCSYRITYMCGIVDWTIP